MPWVHQQQRVPDRSDALAELGQVCLDVGLADHVVANPEERRLLGQPLLLEEDTKRVEQRLDRCGEGPAHEDGRLANVRRPSPLLALAHTPPIRSSPLGDEVLVDVAVDCVIGGVLELARRFVDRDLVIDLLHSIGWKPRQQVTHARQRHSQPQVLR